MNQRFQVELGQSNQVNLLKVTSAEYDKPWVFRVCQLDVKILMCFFNSKEQLLVVDNNAIIYLYDCEHQEKIDQHRCFKEYTCCIVRNGKDLYLFTDRDSNERSYKYFLNRFNCDEFKLIQKKVLSSEYTGNERLWLNDNVLYIPFCDDEVKQIGYGRYDFSGQVDAMILFESTPYEKFWYGYGDIELSMQHNIGVRPHFRHINYYKDEQGYYFEYAIEIFNIDDGEILNILPIRFIGMADKYGNKKEKLALLKGLTTTLVDEHELDEYHDAHDNFFSSLYFYEFLEEPAVNLYFDDKKCFKVDFSILSKPIVSSVEDCDPIEKFHPSIDFPEFSNQDFLTLNIITIRHWDLNQAKVALKSYLALLENGLKPLYVAECITIYIYYEDQKLDDKAFFKKISEFGEAIVADVEALIYWFISNDSSDELYHDPEATFLCYAMELLLGISESNLELYLDYLDNVDMDHDVYNSGMICRYLDGNWNHLKATFAFGMDQYCCRMQDLFGWCWKDRGLKDYINAHYDFESLHTIMEPRLKYYADKDDEAIPHFIEQYSEFPDNKLLLEVIKSL